MTQPSPTPTPAAPTGAPGYAIPRVMPQGATRSKMAANYSLITPDTFVPSTLINWINTRGIVQISPRMGSAGRGPGFVQYEAWLTPDSKSGPMAAPLQRFAFVLEGAATLTLSGAATTHTLTPGGYAYLPPGYAHEWSTPNSARLFIIEKPYEPLRGALAPAAPIIANEQDVPQNTFLGDEALQLKLLLPDLPAFDMALNIFTYAPGGTLPQVEIHIMEHGLLMLQGTGIYRLGNDWFPVQAGDVIWMAPYCEQWFCATAGPGPLRLPARYLYYKDVNRHGGISG